ncbi:MAG: EAL domain-containing protein [Sterolibacterium sp.]|nr:EAL domain-containing protein [Sterolibacterium sp.]
MIAEADRALVQERILQVFTRGEAVADGGFRCKDGRVIPYHFTGQRNLIGTRTYLVGLGEDVSEHLKLKQAMDESEARYHLLFDESVLQIFIMDRDGVILFANQSFVRFNGGQREALIGQSIYNLLPPQKVDFYRRRHDLAITQAGGSTFEDCLQGPDGPCWISSQIEPARDSTGQVYGLQIAAFDNTSRKLAEQALRKNEELLKFALEGTGDAVWDWDIPAERVHMTKCWNEMLGYGFDEMPPDWDALTHPEDIQVAANHRQQLLETPAGSHETEIRVRCKDGHWKWVLTRAMVVSRDAEGAPLRVVGTSSDIDGRKYAELALRENEQRYRGLFENNNLRITILDANGRVLMINESNARMLGGKPADFIGKSLFELDPERAEQNVQRYRQILQSGAVMDIEEAFPLADGLHWFSAHLQPLTDLEGKNYAVQVVAFDITERKQMEEALRKSEAMWKFALEGAGDSVWDWDIEQNRATFTPRWKTVLGYDPEDEPGSWNDLIHPDDAAIALRSRQALLDGESVTSVDEVRMRCKDGSWKWLLVRGMVVSHDANGKPLRVVGTNTDITSLKEHQRQLEHVAHYDVLTHLPNRFLLASRLQHGMAQSIRRNQSLAVAYLDLDGFKAINDRFGHNTGDELLIQLAQRMQAALREGDTLARIGGDEFIAILTDLDQPQDSEPVLQRLLQAAATPVLLNESMLSVSASIGVTLYPGDGADADQLIRHADQAMYQAKQAGKNRYHLFDLDRDTQAQHHHKSIENIRQALARREFVLHYQPKVNMRTGALIGVEALIRWQHPEQGLLSLAVFLPIIAEHELSVHVGEWVIDSALLQLAEWQSHGLQVPISVNIDGYHLQRGNFAQRLADLLAAHPEVSPGQLELEILESSAFDDLSNVSDIMHACRQLGVRFALDDFGTGYASLTYLKRLPAEWLKIDQSFVRDMLDDPDDLAIVEGVIGLAQAFQRLTIAEGVEDVAHGELLLQLGCELAQGYGIARPMAASALVAWSQRWQPDASWQRWGAQPLDRNNHAIAFAEVRHRHWLRGIARALEGGRETAPRLEHDRCPLAHWLASYGSTHYGLRAGYDEIVSLHQHLHELGHELVELQHQDKAQDGQTRLKSLHALQETLTTRLHELLQGGRDV